MADKPDISGTVGSVFRSQPTYPMGSPSKDLHGGIRLSQMVKPQLPVSIFDSNPVPVVIDKVKNISRPLQAKISVYRAIGRAINKIGGNV